jgi:hypothetical protein
MADKEPNQFNTVNVDKQRMTPYSANTRREQIGRSIHLPSLSTLRLSMPSLFFNLR